MRLVSLESGYYSLVAWIGVGLFCTIPAHALHRQIYIGSLDPVSMPMDIAKRANFVILDIVATIAIANDYFCIAISSI